MYLSTLFDRHYYVIRGNRFLGLLFLAAPVCIHAQTLTDFWDDTKVQDIHLTVDATDWATLRENFQANDYYHATLSWNGLGGTVGIRSRGNGSRSPIKPNLDVNVSKYVKKQTLAGTDFFILKANNQDASTIRERIVFKLFAKMGLPVPREVPARVFINNEYFGYYNIVEHLDEDFLQRNFGENNGYLYEWQTPAIYNFEYLGSNPDTYAPFLDLKTDQDDPDLQWFVDFVTAIDQSSDADFLANVSQYLNPRLYLTHAAIENVVIELDGMVGGVFGMNNFYFYHFQSGSLGQMIVWDKDLSFFSPTRDIFYGTQTNVLMRRLLAIPEYRNVYLDALAKAATLLGGANGWGDQEVTREYSQIQQIALSDPNKQCIKNSTPAACTAADFQQGIASLHAFMAERSASVLAEVNAARYASPSTKPDVSTVTIAAPGGSSRIAPGALINVGISNFGAGDLTTGTTLPRSAGNSFLAINGIRAPIAAATETQLTVQVPLDLEVGTATLVGVNNGQLGNSLDVQVVDASPAIFGIVHVNGTAVSADQPAVAGETLVIYGTGLGATDQYLDPGVAAPASGPIELKADVAVSVGGISSSVLFAGLAPGYVGLDQVNFTVPQNVTGGTASLNLVVSGQTAASSIALH